MPTVFEPKSNINAFLVPAVIEFVTENGYVPHLCVDVSSPGVVVPPEMMSSIFTDPAGFRGINYNLHPSAIRSTIWGDEELQFSCRVNGKSVDIVVPYEAMVYVRPRGTSTVMVIPHSPKRVSVAETEKQIEEAPTAVTKVESTNGNVVAVNFGKKNP